MLFSIIIITMKVNPNDYTLYIFLIISNTSLFSGYSYIASMSFNPRETSEMHWDESLICCFFDISDFYKYVIMIDVILIKLLIFLEEGIISN